MDKNFSKDNLEIAVNILGNKWKLIIISELLSGTKRFGELKNSVGTITQKVLTSNLRELEEDGMVTRKMYAEIPPKVEYTLTEIGTRCADVISEMSDFGNTYKNKARLSKKDNYILL